MKPKIVMEVVEQRKKSNSSSFLYIFGRKCVRLITGFANCSIAFLCATSVLQVAGNSSDSKQVFSQAENIDFDSDYQLSNLNLTPHLNEDGRAQHRHEFILLWAMISKYQLYTVTMIIIISIFVLIHSLILMLTRHRRSNYFGFMTSIIIVDLIMLTTIIISVLLTDTLLFHQFYGSLICRITSFLANVSSSCVNWLWVMMFCQRFSYIYHAMHRSKNGSPSVFEDSRKLIFGTVLVSVITQLWVPFIMDEMPVFSADGINIVGSHCGVVKTLMDEKIFKWISLAQSFWIYIMPFLITVFTDFAAVLIFTRESKWFITVSSQAIKQSDGQMPLSLKIQSEESIRTTNKRRRFAVRRCLALATTQLCLNMPLHILQIVDEWSSLRATSHTYQIVYLYADAFFYIFYLIQFPLIAVFVRLLHSNVDKSRRRSQNRRQRTFGEDARSSTTLTDFVSRNKRYSQELESLAAHRHSRITLQDSHQL